jgi:hypothetical protein
MSRSLGVALLVLGAVVVPSAAGYGTSSLAPPATTISSGPPKAVSSGFATFTFTSDDPQARFACALDQEAFASCSSPRTYVDLPDGRHTFFAIAVGSGGTDPTPAAWVWTIDRIPPHKVRSAKAHVSYGRLRLTWRVDRVDSARTVVFRSTHAKQAAAARVYAGRGASYAENRFVNAAFHRYRLVSVDEAGNRSSGVEIVVRPSALFVAPTERAVLHAPPTLRWRAVRGARYYNVQVFRGSRKVLSAWPSTSLRKLSRRWSYGGRRQTLRPGLYTWYVWPGLGPRTRGVYGQLLGLSSFRIR